MALYHVENRKEGGVLAIWELAESEAELVTLVSNSKEILNNIKSEKRRKECLAVRVLLHQIFGSDVEYDHYPNGRPFLRNSTTQISIAHTPRFVVALTHPYKRVGVDIECLGRDFSAVESRALSQREISFLIPEQRSLHLAIMWSAKEALFKCMSHDNVDFAQQMEIAPFVPQESGTICARFFEKKLSHSTHFLNYKIVDNHALVYIFERKIKKIYNSCNILPRFCIYRLIGLGFRKKSRSKSSRAGFSF